MAEHNPIQILMHEHDVISSSEAIIQHIENLWESDISRYEKTVRNLLLFFREYSDQFHHHKEEEVLFPEMTKHAEFTQHEIISELEEHHSLFRECVKEIEKAIEGQEWKKVQSKLKQYLNNLLDHIAAENDEVFIMAQTLFSEKELQRMYFRFQDIDAELGTKRKQELTDMLNAHKTIDAL